MIFFLPQELLNIPPLCSQFSNFLNLLRIYQVYLKPLASNLCNDKQFQEPSFWVECTPKVSIFSLNIDKIILKNILTIWMNRLMLRLWAHHQSSLISSWLNFTLKFAINVIRLEWAVFIICIWNIIHRLFWIIE